MVLRTVFFGSPSESAHILSSLLGSRHEVVAAVTAPDKPRGRGMEMGSTAVKQAAQRMGIPVLQPASLKDPQAVEALAQLDADVFAVAAYGMILPEPVLNTPEHGCVNVHFSLLPRWRGAAPVQWALMEGDDVTGVSIMRMDAGLDTGPVYAREETRIEDDDTTGSIMERLTRMGAALLVDVLDDIGSSRASAEPQDESLATLAPKIRSDHARLDWGQDAIALQRRVRAMLPKPGAWTLASGRRLKVLKAEIADADADPGTLTSDNQGFPVVACLSDGLRLSQVQPEGRPTMSGDAWLRGYRGSTGEVLG